MKTELDQNRIDMLEEVIIDLVKSVVRKSESVKVTHLSKGTLVAFVVKTEQDDVRRVIGQKGKHFRALDVIIRESMRSTGVETHLAIDEKTPMGPPAQSAVRGFAFMDAKAKQVRSIKELLKRTVGLFTYSEPSVSETPIATTTILEVKVKKEDYPAVYGKPAEFEYGADGHIIGAIKNIFDGIGKNNGRVLKIVLSQV